MRHIHKGIVAGVAVGTIVAVAASSKMHMHRNRSLRGQSVRWLRNIGAIAETVAGALGR